MTILTFSLLPSPYLHHHHLSKTHYNFPSKQLSTTKISLTLLQSRRLSSTQIFSGGGDGDEVHGGGEDGDEVHGGGGDGDGVHGGGGGGGEGGGEGGGGDDDAGDKNKKEAIIVMAQVGRSLESLPKDLSMAIEAGRIPGSILGRYFELEKSPAISWLLQFGGFKERLLADDLFLTKIGIECGIGLFTKTAAELEKRRENFKKELDFVIADVIMTLVADFMLVWLPAPTVSLRPPLAINVGTLGRFFYGCPDNAFQVAMGGTRYSVLQRVGAFVRNGAKLFAVGTSASVIGTGITNSLISVKRAVDKSITKEEKEENIPMAATSMAYGVYLSISANLRYQIVAGVIEQRILEPLLHDRKLLLSAFSFAVRTGNTFLGSLMWVDFARFIGIQRQRD